MIDALRARGDREVFEAARNYCESTSPRERQVGIDVLMKSGKPKRVFPDESLEILLRLVGQEVDLDLLAECCAALGFFDDVRIIEPLLRLRNHPYSKVRLRVVWSLSTQTTNECALEGLIELTADANAVVRDWATFELSHCPADNATIRTALFRHLDDSDEATRMEALLGLARRGDKQILKRVLKALSAHEVHERAIEAAGELGDPRCYQALLQIQEHGGSEDRLLKEALKRCEGKQS